MRHGIVSVDIGGSHIAAVMVENKEMLTPFFNQKVNSYSTKEEIIKAWVNCIVQVVSKRPECFSGKVTIAIPGPFDYENGIALFPVGGKYASIHGLEIGTILNNYFSGKLEFFFENDAACFAIGEAYFGQAKSFKKSMSITLGTGIGCAFVENRKLVKLGPSVPDGGEVYHLPYKGGRADDYFSTRWFVRETEARYGLRIHGVKDLVEEGGEEICSTIFHFFAHNLFEFLIPIARQFGAEGIVFGGNISKAWSWFHEDLIRQFLPYGISVHPSVLNEKAICLGAVMAMKNVASSFQEAKQ